MRLRITAILLLLLPPLLTWGYPPTPEGIVERVVGEALSRLTEQHEEIARDPGRAQRLIEELALPYTDIPRMARFVLGPHWRAASPDQRERFVRAFRAHMMQTYSRALSEYASEIVDVARDARIDFRRLRSTGHRAVVRAIIRAERIGEVSVDLQMHRRDETWKVFDVQVEGISILLSYRSDLHSELAASDLEAVISRLEERTGIKADSRSAPDSPVPSPDAPETALVR